MNKYSFYKSGYLSEHPSKEYEELRHCKRAEPIEYFNL